ncbi:MAG: hypothetical protein U0353_14275 [Sandaracinus sp.]
MARRLRWFRPGVHYYEIVTNCVDDQMLLRPDHDAVLRIALALAGACLKQPRITILAVCFVSNHMHLIIQISSDQDGPLISDFLKALDEQIAISLNKLRERRGPFFRGRPAILPILDDAHLEDRIAYTHSQPLHHGLVERVEDWPGISSFRAVCDGKSTLDIACFDELEWRAAGAEAGRVSEFSRVVSVPLGMPAKWARMSARELRETRRAHQDNVRGRGRKAAQMRAATGQRKRLPKPSQYRKIDPFSRPLAPP